MKTLVFETLLAGHRLEYIHHLYMGACERPLEQFVFILPSTFVKQDPLLEWPSVQNVRVIQLHDNEIISATQGSNVQKKWNQYRILRKYAKQEHPDVILLIMMMSIVPFLFLPITSGVRIRGIIYRIYLYEQSIMTWKLKFFNKCVYSILARQKKFEKLFILNDSISTEEFNRLYYTHKFHYLSDPIPAINAVHIENVRTQLGAGQDDKVYLHFGGLASRKGTLRILQALLFMDKETLAKKVFVFAGRLSPDIADEFWLIVQELKDKVRIVVYEGFCPYNQLNNLCYSSDALLLPYSNTSQSSGVIGYAAFFQKPVIGPKDGLLGYLITKYEIGKVIEDVSPIGIANALQMELPKVNNSYGKTHTIEQFVETLLN